MELVARLSIFIGSELTLIASGNLWPDALTPGSWAAAGFIIGSGLMLLDRLIPYAKANVSKPPKGAHQ